MAAVVSDASVLIFLSAIRQFELLRVLYGQILVPTTVWREVVEVVTLRPGTSEAMAARTAGWLDAADATNRPFVRQLEQTLDAGEAEAIALAVERHASLILIDESDGRRAARAAGIPVAGTVGVLLRAKSLGHIPALKPLLDELDARHGSRLQRTLWDEVLMQCGES